MLSEEEDKARLVQDCVNNNDLIYNTTSQNPIANVVGIINNDQYELTYSGSNINANKNNKISSVLSEKSPKL